MSYRKVGGIRFLAIGSFRLSFCKAKKVATPPVISPARLSLAMRSED